MNNDKFNPNSRLETYSINQLNNLRTSTQDVSMIYPVERFSVYEERTMPHRIVSEDLLRTNTIHLPCSCVKIHDPLCSDPPKHVKPLKPRNSITDVFIDWIRKKKV